MIEIDSLAKRFGSTHAVVDVSLTIPAGAVTAVLGLNGAGKSTLLRLIAGLDTPDGGQILVNGRELRAELTPMRLLGAYFDPAAMDPRHTVLRHLSWLAAVGGIASSRVSQVVEEAGLAEWATRRVSTLSLGGRQRLAIASALLGEPQVVVFDEPLNGLDVPGIVWFRKKLRTLVSEGKTVVLASHLLAEVVLSADRVVFMAAGRIGKSGALSELVPAGMDAREYLECELTAERAVSR